MKLNISIIGFGHIGKAICVLLLSKKDLSFVLNIVDSKSHDYMVGSLLDIEHGLQLTPHQQLTYNSDENLQNADVIFHCAGPSVPKGKSRLHTAQASIDITESIFRNFKPKKEPYVIVISNPVEIITAITQKCTGLPKNKVVGTGTFLDTQRMNYYAKQHNPNLEDVNCVILGEHGDSMFLSSQLASINGQSIQSHFSDQVIEDLLLQVKNSASKIKRTQGATIYGVSLCALRIFEAFIEQKQLRAPVSIMIPEQLKQNLKLPDIALSLPALLSNKGADFNEDYVPNDYESDSLKSSANILDSFISRQ